MTLALFLFVLIGTILLRLPVAFALLAAAGALMLQMGMFSADILSQSLINGVDNFALLAIPFFMVAGEVMAVGGLSDRIVRLAMALVGHWRGGLGYVAIITSLLLAGLSGSAVADAAALVSILYPMMRKSGYPAFRSVGLLAAGGIIAPVIPPSLPLIILGVAGNLSIAKLFIGGIVPGLFMGLALMVTWRFMMRKSDLERQPRASRAERLKALRFAHPAPQSDLQQVLAEKFKEEVESASNGDLRVQIFPNGQLGNDAQMIDGARSGIIDIAMSGLNNFTGLVPAAAAFTLPFMFEDHEAAFRALDGEPGERVKADLRNSGLETLAFPENGFREMTNNRGPIREPADLEGLRMRVNNSIVLNEMFELLGANPQQIPVNELYTALETGVVNAQDHPLGIVVSFNFDEVQDYLSMTNHAYAALALVMNRNRFDSLSAEQQQIVLKAAADATAMQRQMNIDQTEQMIEQLSSDGMEINRDVDIAAFQQAVQPVWKSFTDQYGNEMVNAIQQAAGSP